MTHTTSIYGGLIIWIFIVLQIVFYEFLVVHSCIEDKTEEKKLVQWTTINYNSFSSWTDSQFTMFTVCAPPFQFPILHTYWKVQKHCHESHPSIHCCWKNVVIPLPPLLPVTEDKKVENCSNHDPCIVVQWCCWWHCCCCS